MADDHVDTVRALQLILQQVEVGIDGVANLLQTAAHSGREQPERMAVFAETRHLLRVVAGSLRAVRVDVRAEIAEELVAHARKREILLVLLNLIQNAAQAIVRSGEGGGGVLLAGRQDGDRCVLEVSDWAGGVPADAADRIFDPGYTTGDGTGLGLYLSRKLVQANGGTLTYHPLDGGSCFRINLPS